MSEWILYIIVTAGSWQHIDRRVMPDQATCLREGAKVSPIDYNPHHVPGPPIKYHWFCRKENKK